MQILESFSPLQTEDIASEMAKKMPQRGVIALRGDLGAGKTAFVRGLTRGLGLEDCVSSPTFTIVNEYNGENPVFHFDLYRLSSVDELFDIGFEEYLEGGICVIEWPDIALNSIVKQWINVEINKNDEKGFDYRQIIVSEVGAKA